jgi:hypothetical protein
MNPFFRSLLLVQDRILRNGIEIPADPSALIKDTRRDLSAFDQIRCNCFILIKKRRFRLQHSILICGMASIFCSVGFRLHPQIAHYPPT